MPKCTRLRKKIGRPIRCTEPPGCGQKPTSARATAGEVGAGSSVSGIQPTGGLGFFFFFCPPLDMWSAQRKKPALDFEKARRVNLRAVLRRGSPRFGASRVTCGAAAVGRLIKPTSSEPRRRPRNQTTKAWLIPRGDNTPWQPRSGFRRPDVSDRVIFRSRHRCDPDARRC